MAQSEKRSTKELFRAWRSGDAEAGQSMAQRFADWYYAIATSRLGEERGREPCERACALFGQGIVDVTESRTLVSWAHNIVQQQVQAAGARAIDGDEASSYTGGKKPKGLLIDARTALPDEVALLEACYGGRIAEDEIEKMAEPMGGMPLGVLEARYAVKRYLRDHAAVPFEVAPDKPVLDRAPLPLYEADRMASPEEEVNFEQWMLTDLDLCKDIAEFAHFSIALRGGLGHRSAASTSNTSRNASEDPTGEAARTEGGSSRAVIGVLVAVAIALVLLGLLGAVAAVVLMTLA